MLHKIGRHLQQQHSTQQKLALFDEIDISKILVSLMGSVLRQFIQLDPELASGMVMLLRAFK